MSDLHESVRDPDPEAVHNLESAASRIVQATGDTRRALMSLREQLSPSPDSRSELRTYIQHRLCDAVNIVRSQLDLLERHKAYEHAAVVSRAESFILSLHEAVRYSCPLKCILTLPRPPSHSRRMCRIPKGIAIVDQLLATARHPSVASLFPQQPWVKSMATVFVRQRDELAERKAHYQYVLLAALDCIERMCVIEGEADVAAAVDAFRAKLSAEFSASAQDASSK